MNFTVHAQRWHDSHRGESPCHCCCEVCQRANPFQDKAVRESHGSCQLCYNAPASGMWKTYPVCASCLTYAQQWDDMTPEERRAEHKAEEFYSDQGRS